MGWKARLGMEDTVHGKEWKIWITERRSVLDHSISIPSCSFLITACKLCEIKVHDLSKKNKAKMLENILLKRFTYTLKASSVK